MQIKKRLPRLFLASILFLAIVVLISPFQQTAGELFEKALYLEEAQGDLQKAIDLYKTILKDFPDNREISAKAILHIGFCYEKLGLKQAQEAYQQVVDEFPEQKDAVKVAREKLSLIHKMEAIAQSGGEDLRMSKVMDGWGKVSPDGRLISYPNYRTGNLTIYEISSGKKRELKLGGKTQGAIPETIGFAAWSPDGKALVYSWSVNMKHDLRVIDFEGGEPRILYKSDDLDYIVPLDWSLDGRSILIAGSGAATSADAAIYSIKDRTLEILEIGYKGQEYQIEDVVGFSPDGNSILCTIMLGADPQKKDIYLFSLSRRQMIPLIDSSADDIAMGWTRDGEYLIFTSDRTGTIDLWVSRIDSNQVTGEPILIKRNVGVIDPMGISQDGALFYNLLTGFVDIYISEIDLNSSDSLTKSYRIAERYLGANTMPAWSPDGEHLLYISQRNQQGPARPGSETVCIHSLKTKETRELKPSLDYVRQGIWAPDGKSLLIVGGDDKKIHGLHKVEPNSGQTSLIHEYNDGTGISSPAFTQDGKKIYFRSFKWHHIYTERNYKIRSYELDTKEEEVIFTTKPETAAYLYELALSPDESKISFFTQSLKPICTILYTMPSQGGEPKEILRSKPPEAIVSHGWTPDGQDLVLVVENRKTKVTKFQKVSIESGKSQDLGRVTDWLGKFSLHPDGKYLAYTAGTGMREIWVMENFLPKDTKK